MKRPEINLAEVVAMILDIESSINVKCLSYGLYDKTNKEYINESNKDISFDYHEAYENKFKFKYTYDKSLKELIEPRSQTNLFLKNNITIYPIYYKLNVIYNLLYRYIIDIIYIIISMLLMLNQIYYL